MDVVLVPAGHTYVVYEDGDTLGHLLAYLTLLPLFIGFSLGVLVLVRRDLQTAAFLLGILVNEAINYQLKHVIQEARPARSTGKVMVKYGMPSSHAQFTGYFTAYMILVVCLRVRATGRVAPLWFTRLGQCLATVGLLGMGILICASRVYLHYHTYRQVVAGSIVGALLGALSYFLIHGPLQPLFRSLASFTIAKWLLVKDFSHLEDVLEAEYMGILKSALDHKQE